MKHIKEAHASATATPITEKGQSSNLSSCDNSEVEADEILQEKTCTDCSLSQKPSPCRSISNKGAVERKLQEKSLRTGSKSMSTIAEISFKRVKFAEELMQIEEIKLQLDNQKHALELISHPDSDPISKT